MPCKRGKSFVSKFGYKVATLSPYARSCAITELILLYSSWSCYSYLSTTTTAKIITAATTTTTTTTSTT